MNRFRKFLPDIIAVLILLVVFSALRLPGIHKSYYQDEYKWPLYSDPSIYPPGSVPHPPLTEFIYRVVAPHFGYTNFRVVPFLFGFANVVLLYIYVRRAYGRMPAIISTSVFTLSFFSVLASLMIDTDGQILPFFFLLCLIFYREATVQLEKRNWKQFTIHVVLLALALLLGLMVKVSFFLVPAAIVLHALWINRKRFTKRALLLFGGGVVGLVLIFIGLLFASRFIFAGFNLAFAIKYWEHFAVADRNVFQIFIQVAKATLYTSPLLALGILYSKRIADKTNAVLYFFLGCALIFYVVLFDFSLGALDRYFEFVVVPLSILTGLAIHHYLYKHQESARGMKMTTIYAVIISLGIYMLQYVSHSILPLHPKAAWLEAFTHLRLTILYPFSGGSGPNGFYVSLLFIVVAWAVVHALWLASLVFKKHAARIFFVGLLIGLVYNGVFYAEYMFGMLNGNSQKVLNSALEYIQSHKEVDQVVTYNDMGGYDLRRMGKYKRRMYADPAFEAEYEKFFKEFKKYYLVVHVPELNPTSVYGRFLSTCTVVWQTRDKAIPGELYDCRPH